MNMGLCVIIQLLSCKVISKCNIIRQSFCEHAVISPKMYIGINMNMYCLLCSTVSFWGVRLLYVTFVLSNISNYIILLFFFSWVFSKIPYNRRRTYRWQIFYVLNKIINGPCKYLKKYITKCRNVTRIPKLDSSRFFVFSERTNCINLARFYSRKFITCPNEQHCKET